jgi:hypothetical protein
MNLTDISSLKGKVANGGATSQGILTSENWNTLVSAVDELQGASIVAVTPSTNPTSSSVNVILQFQTVTGNPIQCQLVIPASSEASAGVFTPAQLNSLKAQIRAAQDAANKAQKTADDNKNGITEIRKTQTTQANTLNEFIESKGSPEGLTPLNESGYVDEGFIAPNAFTAVPFKEMVTGVSTENVSVDKFSTDDGCYVVFDSANKRFLLYVAADSSSLISVAKYYNNWRDRRIYYDDNGISRRKLFLEQSSGKVYYFDGTDLAPIDARLQLGKTSKDAYPGAEGEKLERRIGAAERAIEGLKIPKLVTMTEADYAQLEEKDENTYYMLTEE